MYHKTKPSPRIEALFTVMIQCPDGWAIHEFDLFEPAALLFGHIIACDRDISCELYIQAMRAAATTPEYEVGRTENH